MGGRRGYRRPNKFGAVKTVVDGIRFDSKAEARRYSQLKLMEKAGVIRELKLQPEFSLEVNGKQICKYVADFQYYDNERKTTITEDVKSKATITPVYRIKKKLTEALHDVTIHEVYP